MLGNTEQVTRRSFLQGSLVAAAGLGVASLTACSPKSDKLSETGEDAAAATEAVRAEDSEEIFVTSCRANCYQTCKLNAHVRDGKVMRMSPYEYDHEDFDLYKGCCMKGMSLAARTYSPNRLQYPMRRTGERGSGQWERITWDEAIQECAEKLNAVREKYGDHAVVLDFCSGNKALVQAGGIFNRFANAIGMTYPVDSNDHAIGYGINRVTGSGIWQKGNEIRAVVNTNLLIIWGSNIVQAHPQDWRWVAQAQKNGAKLICIDPLFSTTAAKCDQFIGIEPGTDPLLALGMIRLVIENDWIDRDFMVAQTNSCHLVRADNGKILTTADLDSSIAEEDAERCVWDTAANAPVAASAAQSPAIEGTFEAAGLSLTTAFSLLKERAFEYDLDYVAEQTAISREVIEDLTDQYVHAGGASIYYGYGPNMYTNAHLTTQAYAILASITGNMGGLKNGLYGNFNRSFISGGAGTGKPEISVNRAFLNQVPNGNSQFGDMPKSEMRRVFREQRYNNEDFPVRAMITAGANSVSNICNQNGWFDDIIPNLDFWVVCDIEMTDSAEYADIVLPVSFWMETEDAYFAAADPFLSIQEKAIDPLYESKQDLQIVKLLGDAMGVGDCFPSDDPEYWLRGMLDTEELAELGISLDALREQKVIRATPEQAPLIRGLTRPWRTDDELLHIYCPDPKPDFEYGQDWQSLYEREHMPYWRPSYEVYPGNPDRERFPFIYITDRCRYRTHTQFFDLPTIKEIDPEPYIRINPADAADRDITEGELIEIYNDRGHCVAKARFDNGVRPGCVTMPKGWQRNQFVAGGYQELTHDEIDMFINNFAYYDALVDVRKYEEA